ncbi:MAG: hypothetical protein KDE11_07685 [Rhodobacteraceae bacterium]|nr:hypothetical protein [Paracoccaceae bacterium]
MIQLKEICAGRPQSIFVPRAVADMRDILNAQIREIAAEGYADFSIRWNGMTLMIEARDDRKTIRRELDCFGHVLMEKITDLQIRTVRVFKADGITPVSEIVFEMPDDR